MLLKASDEENSAGGIQSNVAPTSLNHAGEWHQHHLDEVAIPAELANRERNLGAAPSIGVEGGLGEAN